MKKIGLLLFAACLSLVSVAQNTVDIFSTGTVGSFRTGHASPTVRNDNSIQASGIGMGLRGYAVFSLASIPPTAVISSVELHFNNEFVSPGGGGGWTTRGYPGDLSVITTAATLYASMTVPSSTTMFTSTYGTTAGNQVLATESTAETFVTANLGATISVAWTTAAFRAYTITGETGAATTSGVHAPFLRITYTCPTITSISAAGPVATPCPNAPFALDGTVTGTATTYSWTGPLGFSSTMLDPTVSAGLPSTGTYTLSVSDASGCTARTTVTVPVFPPPSTVISPITPTAFCTGDSATLDATAVPGNTYQWYDNGVAIPGATNSTYYSHNSGKYKVEVTDGNGCIGITPVAVPTVLLNNPNITPGDTVLLCSGDNGTLTVNTNGVTAGLSFQWQKNGANIAGSISNSYLVTTSGTYRCIVSVPSTACSTTSKEVLVNVNTYPAPVVSFSGTTLSAGGSYAQYQWFLNTVAIAGATSSTFHPSVPGSYIVRVTDAAGCSAFSAAYPVFTAGVQDIAVGNIRVYPNPASDQLHIDAPFPVKVMLTGIEGRVVGTYNNTSAIDIHAIAPGLYFVTIYNEAGEKIKTEKITRK